MKANQPIGRLALRHEGSFWQAYYAMPDTMEGAITLGNIRMAIIVGHPERKEIFMDLMREAVADIIEERTGTRPSWTSPHNAPEHEKGGHS